MLKTLQSAVLALVCSLVAAAAIAATPTTNYGLQKPQVGADADQWGTYINSDLDTIDSTMFGISGVANAACPKAGCTFTGAPTISSGTSVGNTDFLILRPTDLGPGKPEIYFHKDSSDPLLWRLQSYDTVTNATAKLSLDLANVTISGASTYAGQATFNGGLNATSSPIISAGAAASNAAYLILRPTDFAAGKPELFIQANSAAGSWLFGTYDGTNFGTGSLSVNVQTTFGSGMSVSAGGVSVSAGGASIAGGLTVTGTVTLPAASVVNADLDTVNSSSGSCGSATATCTFTTNAQGRITAQGSATIKPDTCSSNSNGSYCVNAEGYMHQAGLSASIGSGNTGTVNLPGTCPSTIDAVTATSTLGGTNGVSVTGWTTSQLTLRNNQGSAEQIFWTVDCH